MQNQMVQISATELEALRKQLAAAEAKASKSDYQGPEITKAISDKQVLRVRLSKAGAVSVYGLGKWPVTLYKSQFLALLSASPEIQRFIAENDGMLSDGKKTK